jgi:hypothetical protein
MLLKGVNNIKKTMKKQLLRSPRKFPQNPCGRKLSSAQKIPPASIFRTLPSGYGRVYTLHTPEGREGEFYGGG